MEIRAEEISEIIKKQIKEYGKEVEVSETGTIISIGDGIARIHGLAGAMAGELLEFPGGVTGMVLNLEAIRLFRWRNYQDYGTGVAGDLFVHLLSGLHHVTGSTGPERILATGGLRYWDDGRDVPDVMFAMLDYGKQTSHAESTMSLRVNLKSGVPDERFGFRFMGTDGVITTSMSSLTLEKAPPEREPGYSINTFPKAVQEEFLRQYRQKYPSGSQPAAKIEPERFAPPAG